VIANTTEASAWVDRYLQEHPAGGRTLVWWIHELDAHRYAPRMRSLGRAALAMFDSRASLDAWSQVGIALPAVTRVVHLGVDDAFLERAARWRSAYPATSFWERLSLRDRARTGIREELGIERHDFVVGLIGTYEARKGQDLLMSTVGRMVERDSGLPLKVILVGFLNEAERLAFLEGLAGPARKALADRRAVCLVQDPIPYYAACDALVMNTQGVGENFGRVTIEAMALGLPVLGTDAGGTREIVEEGVTGLLHPVGEAGQDRLAENLLTLVLNRRRAKAMGMAGAQRVRERFASVRFQAELGALLESVLGASLAHRERAT
jgi:glycosyltransferase involved in cell wall biosynthesis